MSFPAFADDAAEKQRFFATKTPDRPGVQKRLMPMRKTEKLLLLIMELRSANCVESKRRSLDG